MERNSHFYQTEYVDKERSIYDIAESEKTYPNKIRRELIDFGFSLRTKSEAQRIAIRKGRHKHPTKGNARPDEVKAKISESMAEAWGAMSTEERERRAEFGRTQWEAMSDAQKVAFRETGARANRLASIEGSKLEKFLMHELSVRGYVVHFHHQGLLPDLSTPVDLFLPRLNVVIEVDGPSHFLPIWGEENLERHVAADSKQSEDLLNAGFTLIRVKHLVKTISGIQKRSLLNDVLNALEHGCDNHPLEIEVK